MSNFKPLRRKLAIVTLVAASVLASGWLRSFTKYDERRIGGNGRTLHLFISANGWLGWIVRYERPITNPKAIPSFWQTEGAGEDTPFYAVKGNGELISIANRYAILPYSLFVCPMTLLSAWLLFSTPRTSMTVPR